MTRIPLKNIRNIGVMGALELAPRDGDPLIRPYEAGVKCWEKGVYVRWGGDTLQFAPPFTSRPEDINRMGEVLQEVLSELD